MADYEFDVSDTETPIGETPFVTGLQRLLGERGRAPVSLEFVCEWLKRTYVENDAEKTRRAAAAIRDAFYANKGDEQLEEMIRIAFAKETNRRLRSDFIRWAKWNNVMGRIVRDKATVYSAPAKRRIATDDAVYQDFLEAVMHDHVMRELDRKLALHEDAWIQYRVRETPRGREPVLDVVSPAMFWAIAHPRDCTLLVGIILDQTPTDPAATATDPHFRVWTDDATWLLDRECRFVPGSLERWELGEMPGVLATTCLPNTKGRLLAECPSEDLAAAHQAVWFENVLLLKESKSASKQTYHSGDTSQTALDQDNDTESDVMLGEGIQTTSIDRGMDLSQFRDNSTAIVDDVGANHGIPPSSLHRKDATSGVELDLRRIPLRELRAERIPFLRRTERQLAVKEAKVNARDLPEYAFDPKDWAMDFGEVQQPLTEAERDTVFEKRRQLLMTDSLEEIMARNPDIKTPEAAAELLAMRVERETARVRLLRDLQALNGSPSTPPGEASPADNGDAGQDAAQDTTAAA